MLEKLLFGFLLSGIMSCIVTLVAAIKNVGFSSQTVDAWLFGWPVAFCVVLVVAPVVRGFVNRLVKQGQ